MKYALKVMLVISLLTVSYCELAAQDEIDGPVFVLSIESAESTQDSISFTGIYSIAGKSAEAELVEVHETTPYSDTLSGTVLLGAFTSLSPGVNLHVQLYQYVDGKVRRSLDGTGNVNLVRGGPDVIGYGWPSLKDGMTPPSDRANE